MNKRPFENCISYPGEARFVLEIHREELVVDSRPVDRLFDVLSKPKILNDSLYETVSVAKTLILFCMIYNCFLRKLSLLLCECRQPPP